MIPLVVSSDAHVAILHQKNRRQERGEVRGGRVNQNDEPRFPSPNPSQVRPGKTKTQNKKTRTQLDALSTCLPAPIQYVASEKTEEAKPSPDTSSGVTTCQTDFCRLS